MIKIRKSDQRGKVSIDWLKSSHTFSFGDYYDSEFTGLESLKVINEDFIEPGKGFATHPHNNMEIISYVLEGELEHKDSMGNGSIIKPGEVQRMSAGTGVTHSEYNPSEKNKVHFLQIWFLPDKIGLEPGYEQKSFADEEKRGKFRLVASKNGRKGSVSLNQDMDMSVALLDSKEKVSYKILNNRTLWIQISRGSVEVNDHLLEAGDGASAIGEDILEFKNGNNAEIIIFDMNKFN